MDDEKVRELLGRYRPVNPPDELRSHILAGAGTRHRSWPWAAAAVLAAILGLHFATNRATGRVASPVAVDSVDALTAAMGGNEEARRAAQLMVDEETFRVWLSGSDTNATRLEDELNAVK